MISPFRAALPLEPAVFAQVRRQAIFDCCKWDPQVEDVATLSSVPLVLERSAWNEIAATAEALAAEAAAEAELVRRPELHNRLGLPWPVRSALRQAARDGASPGAARVMRFDFHATAGGWRISEVNSDVPGGFNEASGFTRLMAGHVPGAEPPGDPAARLADAVADVIPSGGTVALVHATAYTDDRQVMVYLAHELAARGCRPVLAAPNHLRWHDRKAELCGAAGDGAVDLVFRFFPGEWLPNLPRRSGWHHYFSGARTPQCNPATALLVQSKRFPLVWDQMTTKLPTWRRALPETHDPREVDWRHDRAEDWVLKPALGRVGDGVGIAGATDEKNWKMIHRAVRRHPESWIAQRRFEALAQDGLFPCIGVYTVDGRAAGAYGRAAAKPLIDHRAQDLAVLIERSCA